LVARGAAVAVDPRPAVPPMRLLLVIDHLGLGGAQRQIVELACGLAARGHTVELFTYFPQHEFFLRRVLEEGIAVHSYR